MNNPLRLHQILLARAIGQAHVPQKSGQPLGQERFVPAVDGDVRRPAQAEVEPHVFGPQIRGDSQGVGPEAHDGGALPRGPHPSIDHAVDGIPDPRRAIVVEVVVEVLAVLGPRVLA